MKNIKGNGGFTLIELILVIAILGILAVAVAPQFVNIQSQAQAAQRDGVIGSLRDGINMAYAQDIANGNAGSFPAALGGSDGACSATNECFGSVLQTPITQGWTVSGSGTIFTHDATSVAYTYDSSAGTLSE